MLYNNSTEPKTPTIKPKVVANTEPQNGHNRDSEQNDKQRQIQRFTSNMCAVLNDPRKDRTKINYLFTKTWGTDFTDTFQLSPLKKCSAAYKGDFVNYKQTMTERFPKHVRNKIDAFEKSESQNFSSSNGFSQHMSELDQIPKIFFDPNFSLGNKETFDKIISFKLLSKMNKNNKTTTTMNPFVDKTEVVSSNPFMENDRKMIYEADSCREILEKVSLIVFFLFVVYARVPTF